MPYILLVLKWIAKIANLRLILLVLKRVIGIIKAGLKCFLVDLPLPELIIFYIFHFFRAFLTLIDFFQSNENKNLIEIKKLIYACFKFIISIVMLCFLIGLAIVNISPLGVTLYSSIKILFYAYTYSKLIISALTIGLSYYKIKFYPNDTEHAWLHVNYRANLQKHTHIFIIGTLITALLTLASVYGFALLGGTGFVVVIVLAALLLLVDIGKAIYFHIKPNAIEEPALGSLEQQNAFIKVSQLDYYYRKCRVGRLKPDDVETNRIYLLKEISVKIIQLQDKLKKSSLSRFNFFSEQSKYQEKIKGLKQLATTLLTNDYEKNKALLREVFNALSEDCKNLNEKDKTLISVIKIKNFINELIPFKQSNGIIKRHAKTTLFGELLREQKKMLNTENTDITYPQGFYQAFFRQQSDCNDIAEACKAWLIQKGLNSSDVRKVL